MDIWEANSISTALTPHSCQPEGYSVCTDTSCGGTYSLDRYAGTCDANGCDFNPYRVGVKDYYGKGMTVDTSKTMTVVTQFIGSGTNLQEIKRFYVQGGKVIANPEPTIPGMSGNSITQAWCDKEKEIFQEEVYPFNEWGGMSSMGKGMDLGMVLVMSLWDDHYANMLWLDSNYPTDKDASTPGIARGSCPTSSGVPADVESSSPNAQVKFSNSKPLSFYTFPNHSYSCSQSNLALSALPSPSLLTPKLPYRIVRQPINIFIQIAHRMYQAVVAVEEKVHVNMLTLCTFVSSSVRTAARNPKTKCISQRC